jgi:hypothetical protein
MILFLSLPWLLHTAKNQYQQFETNIPRKGIARPQSQFPHSCVCQRLPRSLCQFYCRKHVDQSREYINRSQTHKCGNWTEAAQFPEKEYINGIFVAVQVKGNLESTECKMPKSHLRHGFLATVCNIAHFVF